MHIAIKKQSFETMQVKIPLKNFENEKEGIIRDMTIYFKMKINYLTRKY